MFTKKEKALIALLSQCPNGVDKPTLLLEVFGFQPWTNTHTLETHVWRMRRKIEVEPGRPRVLVTEEGLYRLILDKDVPSQPRWSQYLKDVLLTD